MKYGNKTPEKVLESAPIKKKVALTEESIGAESLKKENVVIELLINEGIKVYEKIKETIRPEDFKLEQNEKIAKKMYEEFEKGKSNIEDLLSLLEGQEDCINQVTAIMAEDFEITDVDKCVEDILYIYAREKLIKRKNEIIQKMNEPDIAKEEARELEKELSDIIMKLAKRKLEG